VLVGCHLDLMLVWGWTAPSAAGQGVAHRGHTFTKGQVVRSPLQGEVGRGLAAEVDLAITQSRQHQHGFPPGAS
jgi:hypothetical protein